MSRQAFTSRNGIVVAGIALALATLLGCAKSQPHLRYGDVALPGEERTLAYAAYTPPGFHVDERLPLVVFLHGAGDGPDCFDKAGMGPTLDAGMDAGEIPRAVIVVPAGGLGFWENWVDGSFHYRDWVIRSLIPDIQERFGTAPCPSGCHLVGISMGGHGALRFLLFEPEVFSTVTAISAPILDTDTAWQLANESLLRFFVPTERIWGPATREAIAAEDMFLRWARAEDLEGSRLMLAWAEKDHERIVDSNERFALHLRSSGIPHEQLIFSGRHNWKAWSPVLSRVLATQLGPAQPTK